MATSITSAGIVFPDSTVQTTAAGAGGSSLQAVASGSLSNGDMVIVNSDGTVSVITETSQTYGSAVNYKADIVTYPSSAYDSVNGKLVIAYRDNNNSTYGTAIVGTISGTSISFGTPTVFNSGNTLYPGLAYDSTNEKMVILYRDAGNSNYGTAVVGTVSGTSISFGSEVVFYSGYTNYPTPVFDPTAGKVAFAYSDIANSRIRAAVGTVSGTSISFGTAYTIANVSANGYIAGAYDSANDKVVFAYSNGTDSRGQAVAGTVYGTSVTLGQVFTFTDTLVDYVSMAYDSYNNKIVISYTDTYGSNVGKTVVGELSGTSISFGTPVVFDTNETGWTGTAYDVLNNKIVVSYRDAGVSNYGVVLVGAVTGTSISFGSPTVVTSFALEYNSTVYIPGTSKVTITTRDGGASSYGKALVFENASTTLTAENFIGVSDGNYSDSETATIQLLGSVDDAQSSLTPGQKYYVQSDGSISVTPDSPEVLAGTAVATTKLVIKR